MKMGLIVIVDEFGLCVVVAAVEHTRGCLLFLDCRWQKPLVTVIRLNEPLIRGPNPNSHFFSYMRFSVVHGAKLPWYELAHYINLTPFVGI